MIIYGIEKLVFLSNIVWTQVDILSEASLVDTVKLLILFPVALFGKI